jgi:Glycosyltransferase family 87
MVAMTRPIRTPRAIGLARAAVRLSPLYAAAAAAGLVGILVLSARAGVFAYDFHSTIWEPGRAILAGHGPYPAATVADLLRQRNPAVYPAPTLVLTAPIALLPATLAGALWQMLIVGCLIAALAIVGVRDWRVFAIVLFSFPAVSSVKLGNIDAFLALGCALAWRWRNERGLRLAVCVAATVAVKLLLWPLLVWLAATGRRRQAVEAAVIAAGATLAAWAVIGFSGFTSYPRLLSAFTDAFGAKTYSLLAAAARLSLPAPRLFPLLAALCLCGVCVRLARRGRDLDALIAAVAAGILASPIVWLHYAVILMVVLAAKWPRLSPIWALPMLFWLTPMETGEGVAGLLFGLALFLALLAVGIGWRPAPSAVVGAPAQAPAV